MVERETSHRRDLHPTRSQQLVRLHDRPYKRGNCHKTLYRTFPYLRTDPKNFRPTRIYAVDKGRVKRRRAPVEGTEARRRAGWLRGAGAAALAVP
jgi:hypothetical protein